MLFWFAAVVFFGTYILIATEKVHKTTAALLGSSLMMLFILYGPSHKPELEKSPEKILNMKVIEKNIYEKAEIYDKLDIYARYVNFNVLFTLIGMMILVNILSGTGIFQYVAIKSAKIARGSPMRTLVMLVIASAVLSAFLDNVTTVLLIIPVTLLVATELGVPALPYLMAETFAANIGGTATLIGDPPNLVIGSVAHLDFMAFLINLAPFIVVILAVYCFILKLYYGKRMSVTVEKRARIMELDEKAAISDSENLKRGGVVMILTIFGFLIHGAVGIQPCVIAMAGAAAALVICRIRVDEVLEKVEWATIFFFMGLFIVVSGAEHVGLMDKFGSLLGLTASWHPLLTVLLVMWISGLCAAIMNNVSYTAAIVTIIGAFMQLTPAFRESADLQHLMWWGLALSVCLGANGTVVGSASNLVSVGIAEKTGQSVSFKTFTLYGIPVTLGCMIASTAYIVIWYFVVCA